jgi:vitamin B12 transporter
MSFPLRIPDRPVVWPSSVLARPIRFTLALWSVFSIATAALAQQTPTPQTDSVARTLKLSEVVVTSSRLAIRKQLLPQKVDIVTVRDIQMSPSVDVGEIVKRLAALDVIQRPGVATYATIRGFRPPVEPGRINPEVSVLINGRPSGTQNLALFDPNSIERIEVLKGAAGAIYGSSTMGGLINIITKQSRGKVSGQVYGGYGSFQTSELGVSVGGNVNNRLDFNFSATYFDRNQPFRFGSGNLFRGLLGSDEVMLYPAGKPAVTEKDTAYDGRERNGTRLDYLTNTLRIGYQLGRNWRVDVSGNMFTGRGIESSGDLRDGEAATGAANRFYKNGDVTIRGTVGNHTLSLVGFITNEENSTFNNYGGSTGAFVPTPRFQRSEGIVAWQGFQLQDAINLNPNARFAVGFDYSEATSRTRAWNQANATANFAVTERAPFTPFSFVRTMAPFAQAYLTLLNEKLIINPSVRYDLINFGIEETPLFVGLKPRRERNTFFSPNLGLQYNFSPNLALSGNAGRAFRFAQAFEIAGYFEEYLPANKVKITEGNTNLKNEQSLTWDAGLKYNNRAKGLSLNATYFQTRVENRVRQIPVTERVGHPHTDGRIIDRYLTYTNADEARIEGLELEGSYDFGAVADYRYSFRVFANATHLIRAEDITRSLGSSPEAIIRIRNVAPLNLGYGIDYDPHTNWSVRLSGRYISKRYSQDFGNATTALRGAFMDFPRYMTLDLVVNYHPVPQHGLSLRVANLTDENYYETRGYNLAGRSINVRYSYNF